MEDLMSDDKRDEDIDYEAEGNTPPDEDESSDPTAKGYDEAAHSGPSAYGRTEGNGGVFGTTGGGAFPDGMHVDEDSER